MNLNINIPKLKFRLSLRQKFLWPIILSILIISIVTVGYLITNVYLKSIERSKKHYNLYAQEQASQVLGTLKEEVAVARTLATTCETFTGISNEQRTKYDLTVLKKTLQKNPNFYAVWLSRQIFTINENWESKVGRYRINCMLDTAKQTYFLLDTIETDGVEGKLYHKLHELKKDFITNPYLGESSDDPEHKTELMYSICIPLIKNDKFMGLTGIDIYINKEIQLLKAEHISDSINVSLVSNDGTFLTNFNSERVGTKIADDMPKINVQNKIDAFIRKGLPTSFLYTNEQNNKIYMTINPIKIGNDIAPWALIVQVPYSKIAGEPLQIFIISLSIGIVGFTLLVFLINYIANSFTKPILAAVDFAKDIAEGNLSKSINTTRKDEIGTLINSLKAMSDNLRNITGKVKSTILIVGRNSIELQENSGVVKNGTSQQASSAEEVSASMEQMLSNIEQNLDNAKQTSRIAEKSVMRVRRAGKSVNQTADLMAKITEKVSVIDEIAFQTNLLALNTAIEASKAGKFGKGFTAVAKEVRKLAEKSKTAAKEIKQLSLKSNSIANKSANVLSEIVPEIQKTSLLLKNIVNASEEQDAGANQINNALMTLTMVIQQNASSSEEILLKAKNLVGLADELDDSVKFFKT